VLFIDLFMRVTQPSTWTCCAAHSSIKFVECAMVEKHHQACEGGVIGTLKQCSKHNRHLYLSNLQNDDSLEYLLEYHA